MTKLKMYFTFSKPLELEPDDQIQFTLKSRTLFLFDPYIVAKQALSYQVRVNLGVMPKKRYCTFSKAQESESYDQMHFIIKPKPLLLFVPSMVPLQVLPLLVRVDLGVFKKVVLYIPESSRLGTSQSDTVKCQTKHNTCIWLEIGTTYGSTIPCQSGPGSNPMKRYWTLPKALKLEPHNQMQFSVKHKTLVLFD